MADVIRSVMPEFGASGPGFAIHDPEVDDIPAAYAAPKSAYFVVELDGKVVGGGGIAPLAGGDGTVCELRKMYFLPAARGSGAGRRMLTLCLETATRLGFQSCYLETLTGMDQAKKLYESFGFERLCQPKGRTGHFGCDTWYAKPLQREAATRSG